MNLIHKRELLALVLILLLALPGFSQDQSPKNDTPPGASSPQTQNPPASTPPSEPQASAPPAAQDQQPAPAQEAPATVPETPPASKTQAENCKPRVSAKTAARSKKKNRQGVAKSKPANPPAGDSAGQREKVVVRNGGATDGFVQLSPGSSQEQEVHHRENTAQLLATTDDNLKRISGRRLTPSEQSTFDQIQAYVRQARSASDTGDLARAHTLAFKAHLLSDDLVKH